ncbi:hypothetical protein [Methylobacterium sp. UNC378MF]|uniref:hypothetical protein n=1 Tax=Methylobacterium sp. UNC378MF TaxID=1502748 RepID=UPI001FCD46EB|nr:hypothetical protein [Methylobacterium sp. UNC378MF]
MASLAADVAREPMSRDLYVSSNGDRWLLLRDPSDGRSFVRHEANAASGGSVTDIALAAFLAADRGGPEHQALWTLIGELVDDAVTPPSATA